MSPPGVPTPTISHGATIIHNGSLLLIDERIENVAHGQVLLAQTIDDARRDFQTEMRDAQRDFERSISFVVSRIAGTQMDLRLLLEEAEKQSAIRHREAAQLAQAIWTATEAKFKEADEQQLLRMQHTEDVIIHSVSHAFELFMKSIGLWARQIWWSWRQKWRSR